MSQSLEIYLSIFIIVTIVLLIVVSVFLVKLIIDLSRLTNNLNDISTVIKSDIEPTIKEMKSTFQSLNSIIKVTDRNVSAFRGVASKLLGVGSAALSGIKGVTGSFWKGVSAGINIFGKK